MFKLFLAGVLAGPLLSADLPRVEADECVLVTADVTTEPATLVDPEPAVTGLRLVVWCGHRVPSGERSMTERGLKVLDVDVTAAEEIVAAAAELAGEG